MGFLLVTPSNPHATRLFDPETPALIDYLRDTQDDDQPRAWFWVEDGNVQPVLIRTWINETFKPDTYKVIDFYTKSSDFRWQTKVHSTGYLTEGDGES